MIVAHVKTIFGYPGPKLSTTTPGNQGVRIATTVGAGNRFWAWPSISPSPSTPLTDILFDNGVEYSWGVGAPVASADANVNLAILAELAASGPTTAEVLTFA